VTALMEAVENQRQVYHRSHRPWKSLQDFHTPAAQRLLINKTKPAEVSLINRRPVGLSLGVHHSLSPGFCHRVSHFENTGCRHPNLRSLQLSLFLSVSNLGSTPFSSGVRHLSPALVCDRRRACLLAYQNDLP
jgi:hypothetical protein